MCRVEWGPGHDHDKWSEKEAGELWRGAGQGWLEVVWKYLGYDKERPDFRGQ